MAIFEVVGVYDADRGLRGEAAHVWGRLLHLNELDDELRALETVLRRHLEASAGGGA